MLLRTFQNMRKNKRHITVMSLVKEAGLDPTRYHGVQIPSSKEKRTIIGGVQKS